MMTDPQFIVCMAKLIDDILPQLGKLCLQDYGNLNEVCMELTRRKNVTKRISHHCCEEAELSYNKPHSLTCNRSIYAELDAQEDPLQHVLELRQKNLR